MALPGEREHWEALQRLETAPVRALALGDYWVGWARSSLRLLDIVTSAGMTSSAEFGPYYLMSCTDSELLLSRVLWRSPPLSSRCDVVVEETHRYLLVTPPAVQLLIDTAEGIALRFLEHPDRKRTKKKLKLVFFGGAAKPGFDRNIQQARWIYQQLTRASGG